MALAILVELKARLEWTLDVDEDRLAEGALNDASNLVSFYGSTWTSADVPPIAKTIVLMAAARFMRNPDGYTQSRAGDESVAWADDGTSSGVYLARSEIDILKGLTGKQGFFSVPLVAVRGAGEGSPSTYTVPVVGGGSPFPFFSHLDSDW